MDEIVTAACKRGFELGEQQGRCNMRKDIEEGRIDPIESRPK